MKLEYTWLPADTPETFSPLHVAKAVGSHLITPDGKKIFDGISSWWCKPLGHRHKLVTDSINEQLKCFEHHIPATAYNDTIEELSKLLITIFTDMDKVMYASDGSSAVEIAMKLSYETRIINHEPQRTKFIALMGNYHGETIFTLSVCGLNSYKSIYKNLIPENFFIEDIPYVSSKHDPLWDECNFKTADYEAYFAKIAKKCTALIIEPIVQGAAGLKIISRNFLINLIQLARKYDLHIISDEIMVGLGRLGAYSVTKEILNHEPDLVCFAKNLTAGSIPMSAVVINKSISNLFREAKRPFLHSHTHSCNTLAAKVAVNYLNLLKNGDMLNKVNLAETDLINMVHDFAQKFNFVYNPRAIGSIAAFDLDLPQELIHSVFRIGLEHEIYLRPIGKILYVMLPLYNLGEDLLEVKTKLSQVLDSLAMLV